LNQMRKLVNKELATLNNR
jgi:hypothetical protein